MLGRAFTANKSEGDRAHEDSTMTLIRGLLAGIALLLSPAIDADTHADLVHLFEEWRAFEQPPLLNGAPDYTAATNARRHAELPTWQARLASLARK